MGVPTAIENWACIASLIETCKLNRVNPQAYFSDLLTRLFSDWPQKRIDELMPWHWVPEQPPRDRKSPNRPRVTPQR
jgi:hypothetical protein